MARRLEPDTRWQTGVADVEPILKESEGRSA
jgi:hypothetical protein